MKYLVRIILLVAVALEIVLVACEVCTDISLPGVLLLVPCFLVALFLAVLGVALLRNVSASGCWARAVTVTSRTLGVPRQPVALLVIEVHSLLSILGLGRGRNLVRQDVTCFSYHRSLRPVVYGVSALTIVEVVVVHLAVSALVWRWVLAVAGVYGLAMMVGFYRSLTSTPHCISSEGVQVHSGHRLTCVIPWEDIESVSLASPGAGGSISVRPEKSIAGEAHAGETSIGECNDVERYTVRIPVFSQVNLRLSLYEPVVVRDVLRGEYRVSALELYADDRTGFHSAVSQHLSA